MADGGARAVLFGLSRHPVRLAEEAAMVSVLSEGWFGLGIGLGYTPVEFAAFGVDMKHRPSIMEDTVEILRRSWTGRRFSCRGRRPRRVRTCGLT